MKLFAKSDFLSAGRMQVDPGPWKAVAIHPSSEVDMVSIGGRTLGVMGVLPIANAEHGIDVQGVRGYWGVSPPSAPVDGNSQPGERLVLQVYECGDALVPPGPRIPVIARAKLPAASVPTLVTNSAVMFRLPFSGRRMAAFSVDAGGASDVNIIVRGVTYWDRASGDGGNLPFLQDMAAETWWDGAASAPTSSIDGALMSRTFYVGDLDQECDELVAFVYSAGGAAAGNIRLQAEAWGERAL